MDNDAISNGNNQMQEQTSEPILSAMTSVTPIPQSVTEDFEPDPKWEMTTLEKASIISDAQMESVIDHVVELGGGQQFSQSLSHHEDKEKAVESIQREIIGCRNPMESLAEVASQQPTLADSVVEVPTHDVSAQFTAANPYTSSDVVGTSKQEDLTSKQTVPEEPTEVRPVPQSSLTEMVSETTTTSAAEFIPVEQKQLPETATSVPQPADVNAQAATGEQEQENVQREEISSLILETSVVNGGPTEDKHSTEHEKVTEPIVEDKALGGGQVIEEPIIEETLPEVGNQIDIIEEAKADVEQPSPVVEEAPSADEQEEEIGFNDDETNADKREEAVTVQEVEDEKPDGQEKNVEELKEEEQDKVEDVPKESEAVVQEVESDEPVTRKSSRRVKVQQNTAEETPKSEPRRASRRSKNQKAPVEDTQPNLEPVQTSEVDDDKKNEVVAQKEEEPEAKMDTEEATNEDVDDGKSEKTAVKDEEAEEERPARSFRTRAPKRQIEEAPPKVEPVKKQVKRSRGSSDQNKSYEATKSTPSIKLSFRSRATISTSDPASSRPDLRYEVYDHDGDSNGKYKCSFCKYSTDRLNNIVFHHKRSNEFVSGVRCPGVLRAAEEQRAEIIRLQQTPKGNKRKSLR